MAIGTLCHLALQTGLSKYLGGQPEILLWDVGRLFENAPVGRQVPNKRGGGGEKGGGLVGGDGW